MVIDNLSYIIQHKVLQFANENPADVQRRLRNRKVIELAKATIEAKKSAE